MALVYYISILYVQKHKNYFETEFKSESEVSLHQVRPHST